METATTYTIPVTYQVVIEDEQLDDVIETALYGGYEWFRDATSDENGSGWTILAEDPEQGGFKRMHITRQELAERMAQWYVFDQVQSSLSEFMCYVDVNVADSLLQQAVYGEVHFG